jgi:hypothetical protein
MRSSTSPAPISGAEEHCNGDRGWSVLASWSRAHVLTDGPASVAIPPWLTWQPCELLDVRARHSGWSNRLSLGARTCKHRRLHWAKLQIVEGSSHVCFADYGGRGVEIVPWTKSPNSYSPGLDRGQRGGGGCSLAALGSPLRSAARPPFGGSSERRNRTRWAGRN